MTKKLTQTFACGAGILAISFITISWKFIDSEHNKVRLLVLQKSELDKQVRDLVDNKSDLKNQVRDLIAKNDELKNPSLCKKVDADHMITSVDKTLSVGNPEIRDGWIAEKARSLFDSTRKNSVLDVSAGAKPYKDMFTSNGWQYYSNEFASNTNIVDGFRGEVGSEKADMGKLHDFVGTDISNTGAPSDKFELVILTEVLEHLPEPAMAIKELKRVVKSGGDILITSPFTSGSHQLPYHFSSGYPREWYQHFANKHELDVIEMTSQGDFFKLLAQEVSRGLSCGVDVPISNAQAWSEIKDTLHWYFLMKSKLNSDATAGCFSQFTIGWMVHLRKR